MESECAEYSWGKEWFNSKGEFHRDNDLPSYEDNRTGYKAWCINGKLHRELGPAIIWSNGEHWYLNGIKYTSENMPPKLYMEYLKWEYRKKNGI